MMAGIATPTEASATGALGTVLLALAYGRLSWAVLVDSTMRTVRITAMILTIVACGQMFAAVFVGSGGLEIAAGVPERLQRRQVGPAVPRHVHRLPRRLHARAAGDHPDGGADHHAADRQAAGFDKVWFCVLFLVMLQTGYLTPPMAPSIFYLRGIAPPEITLRHMYIGIWPFIGLQLVVVSGCSLRFPKCVTWLPDAVLTGAAR